MSEASAGAEFGLEKGAVRLVAYDPRWPTLFRAAADRVAEALGPLARSIEDYGSTSVHGLTPNDRPQYTEAKTAFIESVVGSPGSS